MSIYTKITSILAAAAATTALWSCDNISEDERFIELPAVEAKRTVLLEEYTGQKCVNCPNAHGVIADLLAQHGHNLIAVSIHGGGDAFSYNMATVPYGLATDESQAYSDAAGAVSLPCGVVNRTSGVQNYDKWGATILSELAKPSYIDLTTAAAVSADGQSIEINTEIIPHDNIDANLQLWIVESGIVSIQLTPNGRVNNYEHNHVFRTSVNGHDGEPVHLVTREPLHNTATIAIDQRWKPENLSVVAFVYNKSGVLQAAESKVSR